MADVTYSTYRDGQYINVPPMDELCLALKDKFMRQEETIEVLRDEIKRLKDKNWKDEELQAMKKNFDKMQKDYWRGFPITEEEDKKIKEWINKHEEEKHPRTKMDYMPRGGAIGGCYSYHFVPTSIGTFGTIKCTCGEKFEFQEA